MRRVTRYAWLFIVVLAFLAPAGASFAENTSFAENKGYALETKPSRADLRASALLKLENAREAARAGRDGEAIALATEASSLEPDLPGSHFFLARRLLFSQPAGAVNRFFDGLEAAIGDVIWSVSLFGSLSLLIFVSAILAILVAWGGMLFQLVPVVAHDLGEGTLDWKLLALGGTTAVLGILPPIFFFTLLLWFYLTRQEKFFLGLSLSVISILSLLLATGISANLALPASPLAKAVAYVQQGGRSGYASDVLSVDGADEEKFTLGMALSLGGDCPKALEVYGRISPSWPHYPRVLNNMGVCIFRTGERGRAIQMLEQARPAGLSSVAYNLSQMYRDALRFDEAEVVFKGLQAQDPDSVFRFMNSGQVVVEESLPYKVQLEAIVERPEVKEIRSSLWKPLMGILPVEFAPAGALLMAAAFWLMEFRAKSARGRAYRCRRCGDVFCPACQRRIARSTICNSCHTGTHQIGRVDPQERIVRLLKAQKYYDDRIRTSRMLAIVPGLGHFIAGRWWSGFFFSFTFWLGLLLLLNGGALLWPGLSPGAGLRIWGGLFLIASVAGSLVHIRKGAYR